MESQADSPESQETILKQSLPNIYICHVFVYCEKKQRVPPPCHIDCTNIQTNKQKKSIFAEILDSKCFVIFQKLLQ